MAEIKWSDEQLLAITQSGKSILVNAGAGSGKTAVLAERLLRKVMNGVKLENLIVLTFTKLAASEMKERLRNILIKNSNDNEIIKEQLDFIDQANIQTFDAFTSELVRKYHYLLGISSKINIADEASICIKKQEIIEEIFLELYEEENCDFLKMIDQYTVKDDKILSNNIIKLYNKISLEPDFKNVLENYECYLSEDFINNAINDFINYLKEITSASKSILCLMEKCTNEEKLIEHLDKVRNHLQKFYKATTYEEFMDLLSLRLPRMPVKVENEDEKIMYEFYYKTLKENVFDKIKSSLIYDNTDEIINNFKSTSETIKIIIHIMKKLDQRLYQYKFDNNVFDFNDVASLAIKLLEDNNDLRNYLKNKTEEILIDEYQDTSDLQERLISLIANDNVYMVGDVKQSIYRFRNANPDIFKNKYEFLKGYEKGMVIDLSKNFRSRNEVLNNVNAIFERIMSKNVGGVDYDNSHSLKYGLTSYNDFSNRDYNMKILTYLDSDETIQNMFSRSEVEAFIIAKDILKKVNNISVFDKTTSKSRKAHFGDFVILTSDKDKYELYKKIFEYFNIPLFINKDEKFVNNDEIYVVRNLISVVYCFIDKEYSMLYLKSSLLSVLRSFIVEVDDKKISRVITASDTFEALQLEYNDLYEKFYNLSKELRKSSVGEITALIYDEFNIYNKVYKLNDVLKVEARLNYLYQKIQDFSSIGYSVKDVLDYLEQLIDSPSENEIKFSPKDNNDKKAVKMMSIHASKGLEFPICYFPEQYKKFNLKEMNDNFIYSKKYKLIIPSINEQLIKPSILKTLEAYNYHKEEVSEKIRLLYVALTRPREQFIIVSPNYSVVQRALFDNLEDVDKVSFSSFYDMFDAIAPIFEKNKEEVDINSLNLTKDYEKTLTKKDLEGTVKNKVLSFYGLKSSKKQVHKLKASKDNIQIKGLEELKLLNVGTVIHKALESLDFTKDIKDQLKEYNISSYLKERIIKFFNCSIIKDLDIIETYHEYAFTLEKESEVINGVIDLIIETNQELIVIDYKLSSIDDIEYVKQVNIYKDYLQSVSQKTVKGYLYSIIKGIYIEV